METANVKVVDCTIRDGGIMNHWRFSRETVRELFIADTLAGVDYVEMGYKSSAELFSSEENGLWKFCNEEDLRFVTKGIESRTKLAMMIDIGRCDKKEILPKCESVISTIRVACYTEQADEAIDMANHCVSLGYECFINIMAVSTAATEAVESFLRRIEEETSITGVYVSDTFGSFTFGRVTELVRMYKEICRSKLIGFHGHNNQQLALANTLLAAEAGASFLDATCFGMGRGAGNCPLELLLPQLKAKEYKIESILKVIEEHIEPLVAEFKWGYHIPYAVTGLTNTHPKSAIDFISSNKAGYDTFYASMQMKA
jgi:4-hydroxy 2-oxovalerate aldolase